MVSRTIDSIVMEKPANVVSTIEAKALLGIMAAETESSEAYEAFEQLSIYLQWQIDKQNCNQVVEQKEITFESHPISYILQLQQELIDNKPNAINYEDMYDWYEARDWYENWSEKHKQLIETLVPKLTKEQFDWYTKFNQQQ